MLSFSISRTATTPLFRDFDEFDMPQKSLDIMVFKRAIATMTPRGLELLTLEKKQPRLVPDLKSQRVATFASRLENQTPLAMLRLSYEEFLCCYEDSAVYINKHGDISRFVILEYVGKAQRAVLRGNHLFLLRTKFVEIQNAQNGRLRQVIEGNGIRMIDDGQRNSEQDTVKFAMRDPRFSLLELVLELVLNNGFEDNG